MGNLFSRNFDPTADLFDLRGKVAIVTGGNAGIGYATILHLARAGATVYLAARNESKATGAIAKLESEGLGPGNGKVVWLKLDLSNPRDAKKAAQDFLGREKRLDILVNNAGVLNGPHEIGPDGVATMVIVNYISPVVFTRTLLPLMEETAQGLDSDVRIVNLTSITHKMIPSPVFKEISDFNVNYTGRPLSGLTRYGYSKYLILLYSKVLQTRLTSRSSLIAVMAIHPGGVDTFTHNWYFPSFFRWLVGLAIAKPTVGAYNSVFAAAGKKVRENNGSYKGAYLESQPTGRVAKASLGKREQEDGEELWNLTERFLDDIGL